VARPPLIAAPTVRPCGARRTTICPPSCKACSRRSVISPARRSASSLASSGGCSNFSPPPGSRQYLHGLRRPRHPRLLLRFSAPCRRAARDQARPPLHRTNPGDPRGACLLIAGVPWVGGLAAMVLVLGIAQVPAVIVTLPAVAWDCAAAARARRSSTPCFCSSPAWRTTCSSR
jgi:hypothetical protein